MSTATANIVRLFEAAALEQGARPALQQGPELVAYDRLLQEVRQQASFLARKGLRSGDKVLVLVPMSIDLYRMVLALLYLGAVPVFLDEWVSLQRLSACCAIVPCRAIVAPLHLRLIGRLIPAIRRIPLSFAPGLRKSHCTLAMATVQAEDTALVTFTTGSTGIPKAANRTHAFLMAQYEALRPFLDNEQSHSLTLLPVVVLINLALGRHTVLPPRSYSSRRPGSYQRLEPLLQGSLNALIGSPAPLLHLAQAAAHPHIRQVLTGGGPVFPEQAALLLRSFPEAAITVVYGSTEAEPISQVAATDLSASAGSLMAGRGLYVGRPAATAEVAVIPFRDGPVAPMSRAEWQCLILPYGQAGEIVVSGAHVLKGYLNNEEAFRRNKIMVDGILWHRTGDAGRLEEDRRLFLLGRCQERIATARGTVFPLVLCHRFCQESQAGAAALLRHRGQLLLAAEGLPPQEIAQWENWLDHHLGEPVLLVSLDDLPRDPRHHTKVDYDALAALLDRHIKKDLRL